MADGGTKLARTINKLLSRCHRDRQKNADGSGTGFDCTTIGPDADPREKIERERQKLRERVGGRRDRCADVASPLHLGYATCPDTSGCGPAWVIHSYADVADCVICLTEDSTIGLGLNAQGEPFVPMASEDSKCHVSVGRKKHYKTILKERSKCQKAAERDGATDLSACAQADPGEKIAKVRAKREAKNIASCEDADLTLVDSCSDLSPDDLNACLFDDSDARGSALFQQFYELPLPAQAPECPDRIDFVRWPHTGAPCFSDADCVPGTCNTAIGRCQSLTVYDESFTHRNDINGPGLVSARLSCPGPGPACGTCQLAGVDPTTEMCRCAGDNRTVCDEPFRNDEDDCGGDVCECYLQAPLPVSVGGGSACLVDRFTDDMTGTVDVDTGASEMQIDVASTVYLGMSLFQPCPVCGGTCSAPTQSQCSSPAASAGGVCSQDSDCDSEPGSGDGRCTSTLGQPCLTSSDCDVVPGSGDGVCSGFDTFAGDGIRGGACVGGDNHGLTCDVQAFNTTFPALPGTSGGGYSLDCAPPVALKLADRVLNRKQTTGTVSLGRNVDCGLPFSNPQPPFNLQNDCFCRVCSDDFSIGCSSDADCEAVGAGVCDSNGTGQPPAPNYCDPAIENGGDGVVGQCVSIGDGDGECVSEADDLTYCDGIVRADGSGLLPCNPTPTCAQPPFQTCTDSSDCDPGVECVTDLDCNGAGLPAGDCTLVQRRACYPDPIALSGIADPFDPVGVSAFCVPGSENPGVNAVVGLPGPSRMRIQMSSTAFCASDNSVRYIPGVGNCP